MRDPRSTSRQGRRGGALRGFLLFLAGALLGANVVYYLLRTRPCDEPGRDAAPVAAPAPAVDTTPAPQAKPAPPAAPVAVPAPGGAMVIPVAGVTPAQLVDTYTQARGAGRSHDAIDIMAPAGTPVLAAVDGRVVKLFDSDAGGITLYQFDEAERYVYYYAHLQGYAPGIAEGMRLKRGDVLGYVGSTGNADPAGPHLHFAIALLGPDKRWHGGTPINPYPLLAGRPAAAAAPVPPGAAHADSVNRP